MNQNSFVQLANIVGSFAGLSQAGIDELASRLFWQSSPPGCSKIDKHPLVVVVDLAPKELPAFQRRLVSALSQLNFTDLHFDPSSDEGNGEPHSSTVFRHWLETQLKLEHLESGVLVTSGYFFNCTELMRHWFDLLYSRKDLACLVLITRSEFNAFVADYRNEPYLDRMVVFRQLP